MPQGERKILRLDHLSFFRSTVVLHRKGNRQNEPLCTGLLSCDWLKEVEMVEISESSSTLKFRPSSPLLTNHKTAEQCTEVRFARFLSGGFTNMAVINPPERKLAKRTLVQCR